MLIPQNGFRRQEKGEAARRVAILGSTGSIGRSALRIASVHQDVLQVVGLAAGANVDLLAEQAREFKPKWVAIAQESLAGELVRKLNGTCAFDGGPISVAGGSRGVCELAAQPDAQIILAAISGSAGLSSVLSALQAGKFVALANKESLVAAGDLVARTQRQSGSVIVPVDSEHSAIFQVLQGENRCDISRLILTASGGPFWTTAVDKFSQITPSEALRHPRWNMGAKISVDSATLMNKALEVIEAHWLFGVAIKDIEAVIHPQSIVHSLVELQDRTMLAQLSVPDMCGPIAYALGYPNGRLGRAMPALDLVGAGRLEFFPLDCVKFPAVRLARRAVEAGGGSPAVLNYANELAVNAFLCGRITFDKIVGLAESALERWAGVRYCSLDDIRQIEREVEAHFDELL